MQLIDFKSYVDPVSTGAIIGASALSAGGSVASGLFKPSLKRQWKYQQKQMKLQQQYALEQMQKQGEINYANWQNNLTTRTLITIHRKFLTATSKLALRPPPFSAAPVLELTLLCPVVPLAL